MNDTLTWKKIFSGQFIFTIVTALVFAYATYKHILNSEQIYGIIMLVLAFYFSRTDKPNAGGANVTSIQTDSGVTATVSSPGPVSTVSKS